MVLHERPGRWLSPRNLQFAFGVFALAAATFVALRRDGHHPRFQTAATLGYALAAALSFGSWFALRRAAAVGHVQRVLIVFHLVFVPAQFLFLLAHQLPWLGMLLSTLVTVGLRPRFPRLGRVWRKVWLTLHVGIGVGWLGVSLGMLTLSVVGVSTDRPQVRHGAYLLMDTFNVALAIPSVFLAIVTGVVVSLGTPWGLVRHRWVLAKLVIALSLPVLATFEGPWIDELAARTADPAAEPGATGMLLVGAMALFLALLWTATGLSVFKPGGRTRWGRRAGAGRDDPGGDARRRRSRAGSAGGAGLVDDPPSGAVGPATGHLDGDAAAVESGGGRRQVPGAQGRLRLPGG
ncbi:hypothetical protein [Micromonospora citrea]